MSYCVDLVETGVEITSSREMPGSSPHFRVESGEVNMEISVDNSIQITNVRESDKRLTG